MILAHALIETAAARAERRSKRLDLFETSSTENSFAGRFEKPAAELAERREKSELGQARDSGEDS
jgi:hypothetical protein